MPATAWQAFGADLRAARTNQHRSLRDVADLVSASHSTVQRLEKGEVAGRQDIVRALDDLYGAEGRFADSYGRLMYPLWMSKEAGDVRVDDRYARRSWQHTYPAPHSGDVWILIRPAGGMGLREHRLDLNWGPWRRQVLLGALPQEGAVLVTGKSRDEVPVPLRVDAQPPAHLLFGTDDETVDMTGSRAIHRGWRRVERQLTVKAIMTAFDAAARRESIADSDRRRLELAQRVIAELSPAAQLHVAAELAEDTADSGPD